MVPPLSPPHADRPIAPPSSQLYHKQIIAWLRPVADYLKDLTCGWLIPIAIMFVISFPPLFGHEIVGVLCGLVWGQSRSPMVSLPSLTCVLTYL